MIHEHIIPFLGVSEDVFLGTICMVLPWMDSGSLRHYLDAQRSKGLLHDDEFVVAVNTWVSPSHLTSCLLHELTLTFQLYHTMLGLEYLHEEGIVHGDLHAGNILIDENGSACLTDFGMSLISEATAYNYGSIHGGGAIRWQAPELIDPEEFGLESTRPTPLSDVFSFACTCVEVSLILLYIRPPATYGLH